MLESHVYRVSHKTPGPRFELRFFRMKSLFLSAYLFLPKKEFIIVNENIQHYIRSVITRKDGCMFKHGVISVCHETQEEINILNNKYNISYLQHICPHVCPSTCPSFSVHK